jgi:peptidoglycan/LPS O-acetylase OafA/YrhL
MVVGRHMEGPFLWSAFGWCGVDLFFVLSGFLISGLLFSEYKKTGTINLTRFWIRRGLKIYPPFYFLLILTAITFLTLNKTIPRAILGDIFFLQNYVPRVWEHGWSLAVEEHFYFGLPLLLMLLLWIGKAASNPFRAIPLISITISAVCLGLRVITSSHTQEWDRLAFPSHLRIDALLAGVALGYFANFDSGSFAEARQPWLLLVGMLLILPGLLLVPAVGFTFIFLGFACIVAWAVNRPKSPNRVVRLLAWVGYYSYSIYLWQAPLALGFYQLQLRWYRFPVYLISAVLLGVAMSKLIEIPMLRLRDKIFPAKAQVQSQTPDLRSETAMVSVSAQ